MSRTPRTLSECRFVAGYPSAYPQPIPRGERIAGVLVAMLIGIFGALALVHWAAS